jgi:hypothetical protein
MPHGGKSVGKSVSGWVSVSETTGNLNPAADVGECWVEGCQFEVADCDDRADVLEGEHLIRAS